MPDAKSIRTVSELYAVALAIEREAAARYREFAEHMADEGNDRVAALFRGLAEFEAEHAERLERSTRDMALPTLPVEEFSWLDTGVPDALAHDLVFRLLTPHDALEIALAAEKRARAFFETVLATTADVMLRDLAREMADEEVEHIAWVERALGVTPDPNLDWEAVFEAGGVR